MLGLASCGGFVEPFVVTRVNDHIFRFRQPQNAQEWQQVRDAGVTDIVKLNATDEGPAGFSDGYAAVLGMNVYYLAIMPRGDGSLWSQAQGVFTKPNASIVSQADTIVCNKNIVTGVHCTHGLDRTGYEIARERVKCEGWSPKVAHEEWHRFARYLPNGDRIPSPGLEAAWEDFVDQWMRGER
jgi:hypothetical protein